MTTAEFVSDVQLSNVTLRVDGGLGRLVRLQPTHFESVVPGVTYSVTLRFVLPARFPAGQYQGLLLAELPRSAGGRRRPLTRGLRLKITVDYSGVSIPSGTHALSETAAQNLASVGENSLTFSRSLPEVARLSPGDVIVAGPSALAPQGLLRTVTGIADSGGQVVVDTVAATLEDALESGSVHIDQDIAPSQLRTALALRRGVALTAAPSGRRASPQSQGFYIALNDVVLYDADGCDCTTTDQVKADGSVSLDPRFTFDLQIEGSRIRRLSFVNTTTENVEIRVTTEVELVDWQYQVELARYHLAPMVVWVGWLPIVIEPVLSVNVGIDGRVSVGVAAGAAQEGTLQAGLTYDEGVWSPIADFDVSFTYTAPSLSAGCDFKGYAGPQLSLLLYGVAGPYVDLNGYLQLQANIAETPWWTLYGGLEVGAGVRVELVGHEIADYYAPSVIGYRIALAQAATPPPSGFISGSVRDAVTRAPLAVVRVTARTGDTVAATTATAADGTYVMAAPQGTSYVVEFTKPGYLTATYHGVAVVNGQTTVLEAVLQIDEGHSGLGNVSGTIFNALSGAGVAGLQVRLRPGVNVTTGSVVASTPTESNGAYAFMSLSAGQYTAELSASGYATTHFTIVCVGGTTTANQNATVTPVLSSNETRIILTWGATPSDLDSHLTGPLPDGTRFHMYYPYKGASSPWPQYVLLDRDDTTSFGPETTTILQQIDGTYRFSVHDYSNRGSTTSSALSSSTAQVRVYRGSDLVASFNVPPAQGGTLWTVFELSGLTITPINTLSYQSSPGNITAPRPADSDDWTSAELPPKPRAGDRSHQPER